MKTRSTILAALAVASGPFLADTAMAARVPFQRTVLGTCAGGTCSLSLNAPDGRLEMINVSCTIRTSGSGLASALMIIKGTGQPIDPMSHLPVELLASAGGLTFTANQQTRLFARAPQKVEVSVASLAGVMTGLQCTITGDLRG